MNTADRQSVRSMAYSMEATYRDDPEGLTAAQQAAGNSVAALRDIFRGESDDTLCCVARAVSVAVANLAQMPVQYVGAAMQAMISAYPLAAGALAGVYELPADAGAEPASKSGADERPTGMYL